MLAAICLRCWTLAAIALIVLPAVGCYAGTLTFTATGDPVFGYDGSSDFANAVFPLAGPSVINPLDIDPTTGTLTVHVEAPAGKEFVLDAPPGVPDLAMNFDFRLTDISSPDFIFPAPVTTVENFTGPALSFGDGSYGDNGGPFVLVLASSISGQVTFTGFTATYTFANPNQLPAPDSNLAYDLELSSFSATTDPGTGYAYLADIPAVPLPAAASGGIVLLSGLAMGRGRRR